MGNGIFSLFSFLLKVIFTGVLLCALVAICSPVAIVVLPFYFYYEYKIRILKINHKIKEKVSKNPFKDENFEDYYKKLITTKNVSPSNKPN